LRRRPISRNAVGGLVEKYARLAGVKKHVTCHLWRHSCATHLVKNRANLRHVQEIMGHRSLAPPERTSAMADDPAGLKRKMRPLLLRPCEVPRFLKPIQLIDVSTAALFEENYRRLLREAGPVDRLVLMSPTTIENERDQELAAHLDQRAAFVHALAQEVRAVYVPAREALKRALKESPEVQWTLDGCHPTPAGHALLASVWLGAVGLR